ncbi:MAG TPA: hypothetical protein PK048_04585, partial [Candidatus Absconditabacterales bacterium]|nr:hypothetical protein [Candidatus Absconditabacterales bacterium]
NLNLIQLLEELKKFIQQENGSRFSLFLYILLGLLVGDWVVERLLKYGFDKQYAYIIGGGIVLITFVVWLMSREITVQKNKINIGIADLLIIYVNESSPMSYEQKKLMANETAQYLYSQIQSQMYDGSAMKQLNLVKLPTRIQVTFENERRIVERLGLDILVWGTLKCIEGKYYLNYKLTFSKKFESWAFSQAVQSINGYPDVPFDLHGQTTDIQMFVHQLMWLAMLLSTVQDMHSKKFLNAHNTSRELIQHAQQYSQGVYPVNYLIQYIMYFVGMRNLLMMQDWLSSHRINDILQGQWITQGVQSMFQGIVHSLKAYFESMKHDVIRDEQFEFEFLYAMGNNPAKERTDDSVFVSLQSNLHPWTKDMLTGYFSLLNNNPIDAKLHYNEVMMQDPNNMIALRSLGIVEHQLQNYSLSSYYLKEYSKNTKNHPFYRHHVDVKLFQLLGSNALRKRNIFGRIYYKLKYMRGLYYNWRMRKRYIIL